MAISLWPMGKTNNGQLLLLLLYIHTQQKNIPTLLINLDIYGLYLLDSISICLNFTLTQGRVIVLKWIKNGIHAKLLYNIYVITFCNACDYDGFVQIMVIDCWKYLLLAFLFCALHWLPWIRFLQSVFKCISFYYHLPL